MTGLPRETLDRLKTALAAVPDVEVAALFGSAAMGRMHAGSDVDVYVRLRRGVEWSWAERMDLVGTLESVVRAEVDLVVEDMERTSVILRLEVARHGVLLHEAWPGAWVILRADAMSAYADLEPSIRLCTEGVRRAIRERAAGGV